MPTKVAEKEEVQDEVTEVVAETNPTPRPKAAPPVYGLERVSEPPVSPKVSRGASERYSDLLRPLIDEPGVWFAIATFHTAGGANGAFKAIKKGERNIPAADGEWEFRAVRVVPDGGKAGDKATWSKLYARYLES